MIYVSSSSIRSNLIKDSVEQLASSDIKNIELTGGTNYYKDYVNDLFHLRDKYGLNYLVHNYFPPPKKHFMLNLASLDDATYDKSIKHCQSAIDICKQLKCDKYGVHAGFLMDFSAHEAGKEIKYRTLNSREKALQRFKYAWEKLLDHAEDKVQLYVENNVLSSTNYQTYKSNNPFLLTDYSTYEELKEYLDFKLLLDLAHLKVSTNTLALNFQEEANKLISLTDYLHISGNDGKHDQNHGISNEHEIQAVLKNNNLKGRTLTLEVYDGLQSVKSSIALLSNLSK